MMELLNFLTVVRGLRLAKMRPMINLEKVEEIARNAAAYGWEVGHGQTAAEVLTVTEGNPFMGRIDG